MKYYLSSLVLLCGIHAGAQTPSGTMHFVVEFAKDSDALSPSTRQEVRRQFEAVPGTIRRVRPQDLSN